jgi:hypothetical protein
LSPAVLRGGPSARGRLGKRQRGSPECVKIIGQNQLHSMLMSSNFTALKPRRRIKMGLSPALSGALTGATRLVDDPPVGQIGATVAASVALRPRCSGERSGCVDCRAVRAAAPPRSSHFQVTLGTSVQLWPHAVRLCPVIAVPRPGRQTATSRVRSAGMWSRGRTVRAGVEICMRRAMVCLRVLHSTLRSVIHLARGLSVREPCAPCGCDEMVSRASTREGRS